MTKYAYIKNNVVIEIINIDEYDKKLEDIFTEEFISNCIKLSVESQVKPNWIYVDNSFRPPKPDSRYEWSIVENNWILNKKYASPGSEYIYNDLSQEWIKVILTPGEFFNKFTESEILKWKKLIHDGNIELSIIEDKFKLATTIDIRDNEVQKLLVKLTGTKLGNIITLDRVNQICSIQNN
jgi:hypothetical protein